MSKRNRLVRLHIVGRAAALPTVLLPLPDGRGTSCISVANSYLSIASCAQRDYGFGTTTDGADCICDDGVYFAAPPPVKPSSVSMSTLSGSAKLQRHHSNFNVSPDAALLPYLNMRAKRHISENLHRPFLASKLPIVSATSMSAKSSCSIPLMASIPPSLSHVSPSSSALTDNDKRLARAAGPLGRMLSQSAAADGKSGTNLPLPGH